ncbi:MAG: hypothetical protein KIS89_00820 [Dokdonella sp.]|nr:hypothetical protein [Dokdonella sp.]
MFRKASLYCAVIAGALAVAACSRKAALDDAAPLAYVPTDTPYVFANREPLPEAAMARWRAQMAQAWPLLLPIFDQTATQLAGEAPQASRWIKAILDEVRQRTTPEQWREIGLDSKLRSAFYGVGALPVLRVELADAAAFKAAFERIEKASGSTLATTQMGTQEVRTITAGDAIILLAIEPHHFVLAAVPADANDMVKQLVLGLERPNQSLADSDALAAFERSKGYLPYGSGWLDSKRLLALIDMPKGGGTLSPEQATCNAEREAIAAKLPRLALGYTRLDATRMDVHMRLELEPTLAKALAALGSGMPGAPAADALLDFGIAVPVLKARDFLVAQAEAVAKAPFQCKELVGLNESFAEAKTSLDRTIPPPFADLTGSRLRLDQFHDADRFQGGTADRPERQPAGRQQQPRLPRRSRPDERAAVAEPAPQSRRQAGRAAHRRAWQRRRQVRRASRDGTQGARHRDRAAGDRRAVERGHASPRQ